MLDCADERPYHNDVVARLVLAWWVATSPGVAGPRNMGKRERGVFLTGKTPGRNSMVRTWIGLDRVYLVA